MNIIKRKPVATLGYDFISSEYTPKGKDEYYLRYKQNKRTDYRSLTKGEIKKLIANGNTSDAWNKILVNGIFDPSLIQNCKFYGLVRIGRLEPCYLEFHDIKLPVGLYNSTIISCDFGDYISVSNVNYLSHYIIGNEVILTNINEIEVSNHSKFGNGVIKKGESESVRIWLELCNENGGRKVLPFNGMQAADAWLWTRYRNDDLLMKKLVEFTEKKADNKRGYYGYIGDRSVIKNSKVLKDVWVGTDAYIKGANKLKNLTINSSPESPTQIGEGCELVNGIMGFGCRAFYGVKAVRFILASHSQLKYGARLINSFLGDNSTISCCEVLNTLIFPAHEQHHNNSFLCASLVMGQSNMAAGATIGSNHNSRAADGELIAGRGFWPGLCVSLKHNSKFASFTLIAKGDFPAELNIPIPFSLVANDVSSNQLTIMPAYWFMYNLYALARNEGKYAARDKRALKNQYFEYNALAPDTINEIIEALPVLEKAVGENFYTTAGEKMPGEKCISKGRSLLNSHADISPLRFFVEGFENSQRKVEIVKLPQAYHLYKELIRYYAATQLLQLVMASGVATFDQLLKILGKPVRNNWENIGGQLIPEKELKSLIKKIHTGETDSWDAVHDFYHLQSDSYPLQKAKHAFASLLEVMGITAAEFTPKHFSTLLDEAIINKEKYTRQIRQTREKDYKSPFRKMVYNSEKEMEEVMGALKDNSFIREQEEELKSFRKEVAQLKKVLSL